MSEIFGRSYSWRGPMLHLHLSTDCRISENSWMWLSEKTQCPEVWATWQHCWSSKEPQVPKIGISVARWLKTLLPFPNLQIRSWIPVWIYEVEGLSKITTQIEFPINKGLRVRFSLTWSNVMFLLTELWRKIHTPSLGYRLQWSMNDVSFSL